MAGASALTFLRPRDPSEFEAQAGALLFAREAENNLPIGLIAGLKAGRTFGPEPPFFVVVRDGERVVGAAMRTPPFNLILVAGTEVRALPAIFEALAAETSEIPGLLGPHDLAARAVSLWAARSHTVGRVQMAERIYQLAKVLPPRPVSGHMRRAALEDLELVAGWFHAFVIEAQPHLHSTLETSRANAERWVKSGWLRIWDDGGAVSMAGATGPTPHGIRVGAVYTPPESRRRGYASALVAALSQEQLDAGRRFCFLFTDLANPTSNRIYQDIGYEPVADVDEYRFEQA